MVNSNKNPRRGFIKGILSGLAILGISGIATKAEAITKPVTGRGDDPADEDWLKQLQGKHKMLFDIPYHKGGGALFYARNYLDTNNETGTKDSELSLVVVLRHGGSVLGLNDAMWEKYKLGELVSFNDFETKKPALRNEFYDQKHKDAMAGTASIKTLQKRGALFCVCDKSLDSFASEFSEKMGLKKSAVLKELKENLLPDTKVVPSGLWALGRLQEKGFPYCFGG
jgi:intracellular sulfur oxidation DsrE/DsrF family protein